MAAISIRLLLKRIGAVLWSSALPSERYLRHERLEGGRHRIVVELGPDEALDDVPRPLASGGAMPLGATVGTEGKRAG